MAETLIPERTETMNLRAKNQFTLPDRIARQAGVAPGDRFRVWVQEDGTISLRRCGSAYGKYPGLWGATSDEVVAHIRELRDGWVIREQAWTHEEP